MISVIDSERFGFQIAKTGLNSLDELVQADQFAKDNNVHLLIGRASAENLAVVQESIRRSFILMDTLVYFSYVYELEEKQHKMLNVEPEIRLAEPKDSEEVKEVASEAFKRYRGHYHADPRLAPDSCDAVYFDWALRSCQSKDVADAVLLYEDESGIRGFGTMKYYDETRVVQGPLFGVHPQARRSGVFRSLLNAAKRWGALNDALEFHYSTQITNLSVQKMLCREGFMPIKYEYTLHKWYN